MGVCGFFGGVALKGLGSVQPRWIEPITTEGMAARVCHPLLHGLLGTTLPSGTHGDLTQLFPIPPSLSWLNYFNDHP